MVPAQLESFWSQRAAALVGFSYTDKQARDILERGTDTNGNSIKPPMPAYHLHHNGAATIIA